MRLLILFLVFTLLLVQNKSLCQSNGIFDPYNRGITLKELIKINNLTNLNAGHIFTATRNDTVFAVFYDMFFNNLYLSPIGDLVSTNKIYWLSNDIIDNTPLNISSEISSSVMSSYAVDGEKYLIIIQKISYHVTVYDDKDYYKKLKKRLLFYSDKKGVYKIEYSNSSQYDEWPYVEGEFVINR